MVAHEAVWSTLVPMSDTDDALLQRFVVMEPLGEGREAQTYRGIDRDSGQGVVIKVFSLKKVRDWKAFDRFEREVAMLRDIKHPGIPRFVAHYRSEETGDSFLVMELIEGRPLSDALTGNLKLKASGLRDTLRQVLVILQHLHAHNPPIVHRDIKPANLVRTHAGKVVLVDFGGARLLEGEGSTVIGTVGYMAPEQLSGQATPRSDLYALGVTMCALAAHQPASELPRRGLAINVAALPLLPDLERVLAKMVAPDPEQRFASAAHALQALDAADASVFVAPTGLQAPTPTALRRPDPVFAVLMWLVSALGAGALTLIAMVLLPVAQRLSHMLVSKPDERARLEKHYASIRGRLQSRQRKLAALAEQTRPRE